MKNNKGKIVVFIFAALAIIIPIVFYLYDNAKSQKENEIKIVTNYNDFYTVDSCLYRFMSYVNSKNEENIKLVLTDSYKKKNSISSLYDSIPENASYVSKKMYYQVKNENIIKYYVKGYAINGDFTVDSPYYKSDKEDLYFVVYLDKKNNTFSIEPYSGDIFMDGVLDD